MPSLGEKIRVARKSRHLTLKDLASKVGVHFGTLSRWERGKDQPQLEHVRKLSEALDLHSDWWKDVDRPVGSVAAEVTSGAALDADARKLGEHLARALSATLAKYPQRRKSLIHHWYGQIAETLWEPPEARAPGQPGDRQPEGRAIPKRRARG